MILSQSLIQKLCFRRTGRTSEIVDRIIWHFTNPNDFNKKYGVHVNSASEYFHNVLMRSLLLEKIEIKTASRKRIQSAQNDCTIILFNDSIQLQGVRLDDIYYDAPELSVFNDPQCKFGHSTFWSQREGLESYSRIFLSFNQRKRIDFTQLPKHLKPHYMAEVEDGKTLLSFTNDTIAAEFALRYL